MCICIYIPFLKVYIVSVASCLVQGMWGIVGKGTNAAHLILTYSLIFLMWMSIIFTTLVKNFKSQQTTVKEVFLSYQWNVSTVPSTQKKGKQDQALPPWKPRRADPNSRDPSQTRLQQASRIGWKSWSSRVSFGWIPDSAMNYMWDSKQSI